MTSSATELAVSPSGAEPYRVTLTIAGPGPQGLDLLARVEEQVSGWLSQRPQNPEFEQGAGSWSADDYEISRDGDSLGDAGFAYFKWQCEDRRAPGFWLRLDVDLATEGGAVIASMESYFLERDDSDLPDLLAGPPPLVHELMQNFDCYLGGERATGQVLEVSSEEAAQFATGTILSPQRELPVIAVSRYANGEAAVDAAQVQRVLAGVAVVATYDSDAATALREHLGHRLSCYNGAVRVYWPGCSTRDASGTHRVWMSREVARSGFSHARQLQAECLRRRADAFSRELFESVQRDVEREKMRQRIAELESVELRLQEAQTSGTAAPGRMAELEATNNELKRQLRVRTDEIRRLRQALSDAANSRQPAGEEAQHEQMRQRIGELEEQIEGLNAEARSWREQYEASERRSEREGNRWRAVMTHNDWVGRGLWELRSGLAPYVERHFTALYPGRVLDELQALFRERDGTTSWEWRNIERDAQRFRSSYFEVMDVAALLRVMDNRWNEVFKSTPESLGPAEQDLVRHSRSHRNDWAHQRRFGGEEANRALDSMHRLLSAIGAQQAGAVENLKLRHYESSPELSRRRAA